jgi:hypothetical protein
MVFYFQPCLLNMAISLAQYHARVAKTEPTADVFWHFTPKSFITKLRAALESHHPSLVALSDSGVLEEERSNFFRYQGVEIKIIALS